MYFYSFNQLKLKVFEQNKTLLKLFFTPFLYYYYYTPLPAMFFVHFCLQPLLLALPEHFFLKNLEYARINMRSMHTLIATMF